MACNPYFNVNAQNKEQNKRAETKEIRKDNVSKIFYKNRGLNVVPLSAIDIIAQRLSLIAINV